MTRIDPDPIDRDERLGEAIETYLAEAEEGEAPEPEVFAARYPDLSGDLLEALEGLALVRGLVGEGSGPGRSLEAGRRVAGYRIVRELGRGGMGVVYEAVHVDLDRPVALKVLGTHAAPDSTGRRRFLNEAKTAAGLHHTHIVPVFDVGQVGGLCYYAMQRIEGCGLDRVLKILRQDRSVAAGSGSHRKSNRHTILEDDEAEAGLSGLSSVNAGTISWRPGASSRSRLHPRPGADVTPPFVPPKGTAYYRWVAAVGRQAAEALAHAHKRGVIHRDVKPSNLLVDARGTVWVADFGLARRLADPSLTQTDSLLGTPRYMSPEQAKTGPIDGRTDIYSLGATLYELLALRPPFDGRTAAELIHQIANREPLSPRRIDPRLPRDLETIVLKAMAKRPSDRYASAQDLADDLSRFLAFEPVQARRIGPLGRAWRFARRHPSLSTVSTLAAVVIVAVASWAHLSVVEQRNEALKAKDAREAAIRDKDRALDKLKAAIAESEAARRTQFLSEATLIRSSTVADRRKAGLELLAEAARLGPEPPLRVKLRDEAVEFLSVRDIEARDPIATGRTWGLAFSGDQELATFSDNGQELRLSPVNTSDGTPPAPRVVSVSNDLDFLDFEPPQPPLRFPPRDGARFGSGVAAAGRLLIVIRPDGYGLQRIVPATGAVLDEIELGNQRIDAIHASSDGRRLVTLHRVGETRGPLRLPMGLRAELWDPENRDEPIAVLAEPRSADEGSSQRFQMPLVAFSPDGRLIAVSWLLGGPDDATWSIQLIDAEDGSDLGSINDLPAPVTALAMGPDGLLAAAANDGTVRLWDSLTSTALPGLYHHQFYVRTLRFSPDGSLLAVAGSGSGVELWDPATNTLVATVRTPDRVSDLAFSPDGRSLAASCGELTSIWAIVEPVGRVRLSGFGSRPTSLAFGPGENLALALWGEGLRLWTSGRCPSSAHMLASPHASSVAFDSQGRLAAIQSDGIDWLDPNSEILEPRSHLDLTPNAEPEPYRPMPAWPGLLTGLGNWPLSLPLEFGRRPGPAGSRRSPSPYLTHTASSADGRVLAVARGSEVYLWHAGQSEALIRLTDAESATDPRRSRSPRDRFNRPDFSDRRGRDSRSDRDRFGRRGPTTWTEIAVSSSGDRVYLASIDGDLAAWEVEGSTRHALSWADRFPNVSSLALSPDGRTLVLGVDTGAVLLLDPSDGRVLASIAPDSPESGPPSSLSIAPDGRILAIGDRQGRIALWEIPASLIRVQPSLLVHLPGHLGSVGLLAFDRDGHQLASADDKIVQVWDLNEVRQQLESLGLGW